MSGTTGAVAGRDRGRPAAAIVGAGLMGRWHARYLARAGGRVATVVDRDAAAAAHLARRHRAGVVAPGDDWTAGVDVVHVCTPLESHVELVTRALGAGCHVLVEKPLAPDEPATRALLQRAAAGGLRLAPVHQFPFQRGVQTLLARRSRLGALRRVRHLVVSAGGEGLPPAARRALLLGILPHATSLLAALGLDVPARDWHVVGATDDVLELSATGAGGVGVSVAIDLASRPTCNELHLAGTAGTACADLFLGSSWIDSAPATRASKALRPLRLGTATLVAGAGSLAGRALRREPAYPGLPELLAAFYRSIMRSEAPPAVTAEECLAAAALVDHVAAAGPGA